MIACHRRHQRNNMNQVTIDIFVIFFSSMVLFVCMIKSISSHDRIILCVFVVAFKINYSMKENRLDQLRSHQFRKWFRQTNKMKWTNSEQSAKQKNCASTWSTSSRYFIEEKSLLDWYEFDCLYEYWWASWLYSSEVYKLCYAKNETNKPKI